MEMTTGFEFLAEPKCRTALQGITHPDDVVGLPGLTASEKRTILASWASDASAVPGIPLLRQLEDGTIATIDDILRALKTLDGVVDDSRRNRPLWTAPYPRRRQKWSPWPPRRRRDDDDDPPPCPAYRATMPRRGGGGAMALPEPTLV